MDKISHEINLGSIEKISIGQGYCFIVEDKEIAIFRPRTGSLHAIENRCPHRQGPLAEGVIDACHVICPYHGHKFNLQDGQGNEKGETVMVFEVKEENGEIILEFPFGTGRP